MMMEQKMDGPVENTDRELYREPDKGNGSFYSDSIHVTAGGGIGINVGGLVIVKSLKSWHDLARAAETFASRLHVGRIDDADRGLSKSTHPMRID